MSADWFAVRDKYERSVCKFYDLSEILNLIWQLELVNAVPNWNENKALFRFSMMKNFSSMNSFGNSNNNYLNLYFSTSMAFKLQRITSGFLFAGFSTQFGLNLVFFYFPNKLATKLYFLMCWLVYSKIKSLCHINQRSIAIVWDCNENGDIFQASGIGCETSVLQ